MAMTQHMASSRLAFATMVFVAISVRGVLADNIVPMKAPPIPYSPSRIRCLTTNHRRYFRFEFSSPASALRCARTYG